MKLTNQMNKSVFKNKISNQQTEYQINNSMTNDHNKICIKISQSHLDNKRLKCYNEKMIIVFIKSYQAKRNQIKLTASTSTQ